MKKILNCLKLIILFFFLPSSIYADEYVAEQEDTGVSANIDIDNFSLLEIDPSTVEIGMKADITVTLLDYLNDPITDHSILFYIDGASTGVSITQPSLSDYKGKAVGSIKAENPGVYKVKAVDNTYGYDIDIVSFDLFYATLLSTPSLNAEPSYTKGTSNTLSWEYDSGYEYFLEVSKQSSFEDIVSSSGWISASQYKFANLEDESMYFYRLKKRNSGEGESAWSDTVYSVQDASSPVVVLISMENLNKSAGEADDFVEIKVKVEDNLLLFSESVSCVLSGGSLYECTAYTNLSGNIYTVKIPFDRLERDSNGNLLDRYSFCIEAIDEAGNIFRNCDIEIILKEEKAVNIVDSQNDKFSFNNISLKSLTYLPYTLADSMVSTMTDFQMSVTSLAISAVVFFVTLSLYFGNISIPFLYPVYWLALPLKKEKKYFLSGVVYDSFTKEPLKYSLLKIFNEKGERIGICMTNDYGEFKISLDEKRIKVFVSRYHFVFPSSQVTEKTDYPYINVYTEGFVNFRNSNEAYISVPLDMRNENLFVTELKRAFNILIYIFLLFSFVFSIFLSFFLFSGSMNTFNFLLLMFNILDAVLLMRFIFGKFKRKFLVKNEKGKPVSGITVVVKNSKSGKVIGKRVTKKNGKYSFDLKAGEYVLDILNTDFELVAVEKGREFKISDIWKEHFGRDLIVEKK